MQDVKLRHSMRDRVRVRLVSADLWAGLGVLNGKGIEIFRLELEDDLTCSFEIKRQNVSQIRRLLERRGDILSVKEHSRLFAVQQSVLSRPVLWGGMVSLLVISLFLPTRILGIQVEGNHAVPTRKILEAAEDAGIRLMVPCAQVRSERIKNRLLSAIPELQWAGINTYGCRVVISVRERAALDETEEHSGGVGSIVASRDGVVESVTVIQGTVMCQPGQAVQKGQILISGYTDCGLSIRASRAKGEVYAQTIRTVRAVTPDNSLYRPDETDKRLRLAILVGKKQINLWKDSGISDSTCGRICREYPLRLPGGFLLPISLRVETVYTGRVISQPLDGADMEEKLSMFSQKYLSAQMIAGTVSFSDEVLESLPGAYLLTRQFLCSEMIGRLHLENGDSK